MKFEHIKDNDNEMILSVKVTNIVEFSPTLCSLHIKCKAKLRDQVPEAYEICCVLVHFMADFEKTLAPHHMVKAKAAMLKGTYDKEIIEKVRTQAPDLNATQFRFVQMLQGSGIQILSVDEQAIKASEELEVAKFKSIQVGLLKEQQAWQDYQASVQNFEQLHKTSLREHLLKEKQEFQSACKSYQELRFPLANVTPDESTFMVTQVLSQVETFTQSCGQAASFTVVIVDFTKLGMAWSKFLNDIVAKLSAVLAANPEKACGIVIAPNRAQWGESDTENKLLEAVSAVDAELRTSEAELDVRKVQLVFTESSLHDNSNRAAYHDAWMVLSNASVDKAWAQSHLWIRRCIQGCEAKSVSETVINSLQIQGGASSMNASRAQRAKQAISGAQLWGQVLAKLWQGMKVQDLSLPVFYLDMLPYDSSIMDAVLLRMSQSKQPCCCQSLLWAMERPDPMEQKCIYKFLLSLWWRRIAKLAESKTIESLKSE